MYINQIDEIYDKLLNMLYDIIIQKKLIKYFKSKDLFINNFKQVNIYIYELKDIIMNDVMNLFNSNENIEYTKEKIIEYLYIYIFLLYGYYEIDNELYLNTIYSIIQKNDIFNNELIYKLQISHKNILIINQYLNDNIENEYIKNIFKGINIKYLTKSNINHNIVKIIIIKDIYLKEDKNNLFKKLEYEEINNKDSKIIEIVEYSYDNNIDYSVLENLFKNIKNSNELFINNFYDFLIEYNNEMYKSKMTINNKINILFERKILIPIVDDFFRYNMENDKNHDNKLMNTDTNENKHDTKIKYIISKTQKLLNIDRNINDEELEKLYYNNLQFRDSIITNNIDEIEILNRIEKNNDISNFEYYNELINIRKYVYLSYKSLLKDSISFNTNKIIPCIRYTNFKYNNNKDFNNNNNIEWRISYPEDKINLIGVALINKNIITKKNNFEYKQHKNYKNTKEIFKNGYKVISNRLNELILNNKKYNKILYWLFDNKTDIINSKNSDNIISNSDNIYNLFNNLYNEIMKITNKFIINEINNFKGSLNKIIDFYYYLDNKLIPLDIYYKNKIMKIIYNKYNKIYNEMENETNKLYIPKKIIKLPSIIYTKNEIPIIYISNNNDKTDINTEKLFENTICQHVITWKYINSLKKYKLNQYNQQLFEFTNKFVYKNDEDIYICKSCSETLNIQEHISSWKDENNDFILNYNLNTDLNDIYEYSNYNKFIKTLDNKIKIITEKIGLKSFLGKTYDSLLKKQNIIKNIIDITNIQYKIIFHRDYNTIKEREITTKKYNIINEYSSYFLFKIYDELFSFSSKETDKSKEIKINCIYGYVIYFILVDLNDINIKSFSFDKVINYVNFEKYGYSIFNDILIRYNNTDKLEPIKNNKLLCYVIYFITGFIIKLNLWNDDIKYIKNKLNLTLHKKVIHTFLHILNNILEINHTYKNNLYSSFSSKFYQCLKNIYLNKIIYNHILEYNSKSLNKIINTDNISINLTKKKIDNIKPISFDHKDVIKTYFDKKILSNITYLNLSNSYVNNSIYNNLSKYSELNNKLLDKIFRDNINKYYFNGNKRTDLPNNKEINDLLKYDINDFLTNIRKIKLSHINDIQLNSDINDKIFIKNNLKFTNIFHDIDINNNIESIIDEFINFMNNYINNTTNISNIKLNNNIYIISNDYLGNKIDNIILTENDINILKNNKTFNQDVYYYFNSKNNITLYYSYITKQYLGFKENNQQIKLINNTNNYLIINLSIRNKLLYLGFNYLFNEVNYDNKIDLINNLFRNRLNNIKNIIYETLQIINKIKNKKIINYNDYNKFIINDYIKKIDYLNIYDINFNKIFNEWNNIKNIINIDNIDNNININTITFNNIEYIESRSLLKFKNNINRLIIYFINNLKMLINIQNNEYIKNNICLLIINIINNLFDKYNIFENSKYNINSKQFFYYFMSNTPVKNNNNIYNIDITIDNIYNDNYDNNDDINITNKIIDEFEKYDSIDVEDYINDDYVGDDYVDND